MQLVKFNLELVNLLFNGIIRLKLEKAENISTKYDSFTNL